MRVPSSRKTVSASGRLMLPLRWTKVGGTGRLLAYRTWLGHRFRPEGAGRLPGRRRARTLGPLWIGPRTARSGESSKRRQSPRGGSALREQPVDGLEIPLPAATDDLVRRRRRGHRDPPPRLTRRDVADVDLDRGAGAGRQRVVQRVAGVRQRAEVAHDRVVVEPLQPVDQGALVVRLERVQQRATFQGPRTTGLDDLVEGGGAVDLRLPPAQGSEVRSVEEEDAHR